MVRINLQTLPARWDLYVAWVRRACNCASLRAAIVGLRERGETVVCVLPGHESEVDEFHCDRELVEAAGQWLVQAL